MGMVQGAVGARAFLVRGAEVRPWDPPLSVDRDGSVHIEGPVEALFGGVPAGRWEIVLAVGRPETLPRAATDVLRIEGVGEPDASSGHAAWQVVREPIVLEG
jgi:hypothetical protein